MLLTTTMLFLLTGDINPPPPMGPPPPPPGLPIDQGLMVMVIVAVFLGVLFKIKIVKTAFSRV